MMEKLFSSLFCSCQGNALHYYSQTNKEPPAFHKSDFFRTRVVYFNPLTSDYENLWNRFVDYNRFSYYDCSIKTGSLWNERVPVQWILCENRFDDQKLQFSASLDQAPYVALWSKENGNDYLKKWISCDTNFIDGRRIDSCSESSELESILIRSAASALFLSLSAFFAFCALSKNKKLAETSRIEKKDANNSSTANRVLLLAISGCFAYLSYLSATYAAFNDLDEETVAKSFGYTGRE